MEPEAQEVRTLFTQMMLDRGIFATGSFYAMWAHTGAHVDLYLEAVNAVFRDLRIAIDQNAVRQLLRGPVAHSGFKRLTRATPRNFANHIAAKFGLVFPSYRPKTCRMASAFSRTAVLARNMKIGMATINSNIITRRTRLRKRLGRLIGRRFARSSFSLISITPTYPTPRDGLGHRWGPRPQPGSASPEDRPESLR
jgi:hypothetical protein